MFARHRLTIARVLAALAGLFFVVATLPQAISPWGAVTLSNMQGVHDPNLHRWSAALAGGPDLGGAAVLFYIAWRPQNVVLLLQWLALAVIIFLVANVPFVGVAVAVIAIPIVLVLAIHPETRRLLTAPWSEGVSPLPLALGALIAIALFFEGALAFSAQIRGADEVAANYDWASDGEHLVNIGVAALLSAVRKPGSMVLRLMVAAVLAFMGAAAITVPDNPGSWGTLGGVIAIVAALAFALTAVYEWRQRTRMSAVAA